jgi:hypothetical protein
MMESDESEFVDTPESVGLETRAGAGVVMVS